METKIRISQGDFAGRSDDWLAGFEAGSLAGATAERERCARIAEGFKTLDVEEDKPLYQAKTIGNAVAISIRGHG